MFVHNNYLTLRTPRTTCSSHNKIDTEFPYKILFELSLVPRTVKDWNSLASSIVYATCPNMLVFRSIPASAIFIVNVRVEFFLGEKVTASHYPSFSLFFLFTDVCFNF